MALQNSKRQSAFLVLALIVGTLTGAAIGAGSVFYFKTMKPKFNHQIRLLTYRKWLSAPMIERFLNDEKILIEQDVATSSSDFFSRLSDPTHDYDLVSIASWQIPSAIDTHLLEPLKKGEIPLLRLIAADFRQLPQDRDLFYSVPLFWGANGIVYNKTKVGKKIQSWVDIFNDPNILAHTALLNEPREIMSGLIRRNSLSEKSIADDGSNLKKSLNDILPFAKYSAVQALKLLGKEDVWVAELPQGLASIPLARNSDYIFVLPDESATLWTESLVIAKGTNKSAQVYRFINYLLQKDVARSLVQQTHMATTLTSLEDEVLHPMLKASYVRSLPLNKLQVIEPINHMAKQWEDAISSATLN
ncbi:MAG: extracellular solute-binding protein [Pseudomonadota bacterium]|nr:extracellular solute-binding protein [Pseudomonadota bacterium]